MRETSFIQQNKDKWSEFDAVLNGQYKDADKLNDLFVHITDDLSYSRTFYPNRSVRVYLNGLAQRIFFSIYKNKKTRLGRFLTFWTDDVPQLVFEARKDLRLSFWVFVLSFSIGALSSAFDPEFATVIMGEDYIEMTRTNIESGDPMAVYKQKGAFGMSLGITINNLYVAFLTFALGVLFSVGSIVMVARNGFMVGAFQWFFIEQGLFRESFLTIWIHGTLEISAIVIAGAAGITLGRGLVFPGTYTRLRAFQRSARRGIKIMIGIVPIFVLAGFIEGFLTRYTETPDVIRGAFIAVCLAFILVYFVWYPRWRAAIGFPGAQNEMRIPPDSSLTIDFGQIKSPGEIFADTFVFFKKYFSRLALILIGLTAAVCGAAFFFSAAPPAERFFYEAQPFELVQAFPKLLTFQVSPILPWANGAVFGIVAFLTGRWMGMMKGRQKRGGNIVNLLKCILTGVLFSLMLSINAWFTFFLFLFGGVFFMVWFFVSQQEGSDPASSLIRTFNLTGGDYWRSLGVFILAFIVSLIFAFLADTALVYLLFELVGWIIHFDQEVMNNISVVLLTGLYLFLSYLLFAALAISGSILYFTLLEIREAPALRLRMEEIGSGRTIKGMERE